MKKFIVVFLVLMFCYIGYLIKEKYKNQKIILEEIKNFVEFFRSNIMVLKTSVLDIVYSYKNIQNNKNALSFKMFQNNENLFKFNENFANRYIYDEKLMVYIRNYFEDFGLKTHCYELEKTDNFLLLLNDSIQKTTEEIKMKGDLWFKLFVAIGLVIAIVIW